MMLSHSKVNQCQVPLGFKRRQKDKALQSPVKTFTRLDKEN